MKLPNKKQQIQNSLLPSGWGSLERNVKKINSFLELIGRLLFRVTHPKTKWIRFQTIPHTKNYNFERIISRFRIFVPAQLV
jgi:hypothetical protein